LFYTHSFRESNPKFVFNLFQRVNWKQHNEAGGVPSLSKSTIEQISLNLPSLKEQTKIASFLSEVDYKLQTLKQKKKLLKQYKKGVMQKIFSQELRFKDDNGNDYPNWEEKKLGDIGETYNGLTGKSKEHFGDGKPYIQYKQIFDDSKIDISRFELVKISSTENQNKVVFGDVFFTVSSETPNEIGTASVLLDDIQELYLNSFCFGYRASNLYLSPYFSRYLFRNELFRNQIIKLAQGSTRFNMSKVQLMKLIVKLPCLEEQTKIANFLSAIDDKINNCQSQIEKTQVWKKGLLQQMFV
jgi:type I restriction enzyme S subunit